MAHHGRGDWAAVREGAGGRHRRLSAEVHLYQGSREQIESDAELL